MTTDQPVPPAPWALDSGGSSSMDPWVSSLQAPSKEQRRKQVGPGPQHLLQTTRCTLTHPPRGTLQIGEGLLFFSLILNVRRDRSIIQKLDCRPLHPFGDNGCDIGRSTEVWFCCFLFLFFFGFFFLGFFLVFFRKKMKNNEKKS